MHCTKRITADMLWVGADDRRLAVFEGVYGVPDGVSYNSYLINDEKTILFDTVDKAVAHNFFDNGLSHSSAMYTPLTIPLTVASMISALRARSTLTRQLKRTAS